MLVLIIVAVAAVLLFGVGQPPNPGGNDAKKPTPKTDGGGGGIDFGKVAGAAGSVVALGGTVLTALGVGGGTTATAAGGTAAGAGGTAAASGTTAAGGTAAGAGGSGGTTVAGGSGAVAGTSEGAADALAVGGEAVSGVSTGLEALVATSPVIIAALAVAIAITVFDITGRQNNYWQQKLNKGPLFYARWFAWEERSVEAYVTQLSQSRGGTGDEQVAHTMLPVDFIDGADGSSIPFYGYIVDSFSDVEASRDVPKVRTFARWYAIVRERAYNRAVANFWASIPLGGGGSLPSTQTSPGLTDSDFDALADQYLRTQPYAQKQWLEGGTIQGGTSIADSGLRTHTLVGTGTPRVHSYQPLGVLPYADFASLDAAVQKLAGDGYAALKAQAETYGAGSGMFLAGKTGYSFAWPGDEDFARNVPARCGLDWPVSLVRTSANQQRWIAFHPVTNIGFDVVAAHDSQTVYYLPGSTSWA